MTSYQIKGIKQGEGTCGKCGSPLKQAIILAPLDLGGTPERHPFYVGADCAAKLTRLSQATVRLKAVRAEEVRQAELQVLRRREAYRRRWEQREREWLQDTYGVEDMRAASEKSGKDWLTVFNEFRAWLDQVDGMKEDPAR
ncbi:hypothetical protein ACFV7R_10160 [Streptomyces sp. NPDC059866]|uniref:hypothetical protein n=1 Tax=Streptomyces sp. NPDC059866 TaxID=3346978 RepID=UPI003653D54A